MLLITPMRRKELERPGKGLTFAVLDDGQNIGRIMAAEGLIVLGDRNYSLRSEDRGPGTLEVLANLLKGRSPQKQTNPTLLIAADGSVVAAAQKSGRRSFAVGRGRDTFRFERAGFVSSTWNLYTEEGGAPLGSVAKQGWFGVTCTVDMPDMRDKTLPVFLFWLRYAWELEQASNASTYQSYG